jgi:triosephosphate isomerase (TIM)
MRKKIIAGNWKMNKTFGEGLTLIEDILTALSERSPERSPAQLRVVLAPPSILLREAAEMVGDNPWVEIAAQNCHQQAAGAYTGEISASMVRSTGATRVILGHSERRAYFAENHLDLAAKVKVVLENDMIPIFCCGEVLSQRQAGNHFDFVEAQLRDSLFDLDEADMLSVVIAYEPVWAIGTGVNASAAQAQEMHAFIRNLIASRYGSELADSISILYGGSLKPSNAAELFAQPDVDGGLIGGASLEAASFLDLIYAI